MLTTDFYKLLDSELEGLFEKYPENVLPSLHKHKDKAQNKGYAFLVWFLDFYGQTKAYQKFITDGVDDYACDIIFENIDSQGQKIFYIVQSKWVNLQIDENGNLTRKKKTIQEFPKIKKEEFNATITEFSTIVNGTRQKGQNEKFNEKYDELSKHLEANGKAKFIFFTAGERQDEITDTVNSFIREYSPNVTLEVIDIHKIKRDYIEFRFKEITTNNPLEYQYDPEEDEITLNIERVTKQEIEKGYLEKRDVFQFEGAFQAYILLLKPKTVYELFRKYKFSLFFKNVRNPLHQSNYNKNIVETLKKRPSAFWYFNNGVTAITKLIPDFGHQSKELKIIGLQVINGAQTIYSVYKAYEEASTTQRQVMDADARISLRLIRSSDEDFNLDITRFTNQQNEMEARDFVSNLPEQTRLQEESFKTNFWYERRRGEFRNQEIGKNIQIISNEVFGWAYLAFQLQRPIDSVLYYDNIFIKRVDDAKGLYEEIFNEQTTLKKMLSSYMLYFLVNEAKIYNINNADIENRIKAILLALSKLILEKYLVTISDRTNIDNFVIDKFMQDTSHTQTLIKIIQYALLIIDDKCYDKTQKSYTIQINKLLTSQSFYEVLKYEIEEREITREDIENIELPNEEKPS